MAAHGRLDATGAFSLCGGGDLRRVLVTLVAHAFRAGDILFQPLAGGL